MNYFQDIVALHKVLVLLCDSLPAEQRRVALIELLESWQFSREQAETLAWVVFFRNEASSAEHVLQNAKQLVGRWVRGSQTGQVVGLLQTSKETWQFNRDLTYENRLDSHEGYLSSSPYMSSYSRPRVAVSRGIWAPCDTPPAGRHERAEREVTLFMLPPDGYAHTRKIEWHASPYAEPTSFSTSGERFGRE